MAQPACSRHLATRTADYDGGSLFLGLHSVGALGAALFASSGDWVDITIIIWICYCKIVVLIDSILTI